MDHQQPDTCVFCRIVRAELPAVRLFEDDRVLAIMDLFPATAGHLLVLPREHIETVYTLPASLGGHIMAVAVALAKAVKHHLAPDGINLIQANEAAAGQTIPHFHLHIVPRYRGDVVRLHFGHGATPAKARELEELAAGIRAALPSSGSEI